MATRLPGSIYSAGLVLQDRYRLDEPLASGGMAEVWRGHDLVLQRPVAIKLLHPHLASDEAVVERFRREAISAAKLSHPNIVPTYDAGTDKGATFIVLGLVQGPSLAGVLEGGGVTEREAVSIARQVAEALEHAHRKGLVHRDVKPANVLVVDDEKRVMVADFGIAKAIAEASDESLTLPGLVIGTPAYVAPEVLAGDDADERSDIYAVGVMLHEMICGPHHGDQPTQLTGVERGAAEDHHCEALPPVLATIVDRATAPDRADRYASAADLAGALRAGEPRRPKPTPSTATQRPPMASTSEATTQHEVLAPAMPPGTASDTQHPPSSSRNGGRRRTLVSIVVALLLLAAAIVVGRVLASEGDQSGGRATSTMSAPLAFSSVRSFDPQGDDHAENETSARLAIDGSAVTAWTTQSYGTRKFGNLKAGVGLIVALDHPSSIHTFTVESATSGWSAAIYIGSGTPADLAGWGAPVAQRSNIDGTGTFDLGGKEARAVLIWITDLGTTSKASVSEVKAS